MNIFKKVMVALLVVSVLVPGMQNTVVHAETEEGNVTFPSGITWEMTDASYWKELANEADKVLMTPEEIEKLNQEIIDSEGSNVVDLETIENPIKLGFERFNRNLYVNGTLIDEEEYIQKFERGKGSLSEVLYAVAVKRADIKAWPTNEVVGYSAKDPDDEIQVYAVNVNEPVVIRAVCTVEEQVFYFCQTKTCAGWIYEENLAVFDSKEEWLEAWKYDVNDKDILVVTGSKIMLEPSIRVSSISEIQLMQGTVLKLVPEDEIPKNIGERGTWFNYVVYVPTRDENGKYIREYALISKRYEVSVGFPELTQANLLEVAFASLGDRYGWGAMLGSNDCSSYTRAIYQCFGLELPRNTAWQQKVPGKLTALSEMTDEEKQEYLETIPVGSLLYFPGHTMVYVGSKDGVGYAISATGSVVDSEGDIEVISVYSVILNPLTVRRKSGNTWLNQLNYVLTFGTVESNSKKMYTVQQGDCLREIAEEQLGDMSLWKKIYEANAEQISDPDLIYANQELLIP